MRCSTGVTAAAVGSLLMLSAGCGSPGPQGSPTWSASPMASHVAHCRAGSAPDKPGPPDQPRPPLGTDMVYRPAAMDSQSGHMVVWDPDSRATWTFDVCTNTWQPMRPIQEPALDR